MLLTATVGFGGVLNAGTGAATIKTISADIGRGEVGGSQVRVSLGIAMIGGGLLSLLVLAMYWLGGGLLLGRMGTDTALVQLTGVAAAVLLWLEQLDNVASSAMKGAERFGHAARVEIIFKTTQITLAALAMWRWPMLSALYVALVAGAGVRLAAKLCVARRLLGLTSLRPTLRGATSILNYARWGWLQGIGSVLFGVADRFLVGAILGASSLAYYSIASQLAMQVHAISAAGLSVIFPSLSRRLEGSNPVKLLQLVPISMIGSFCLSSLLAVTLMIFGPLILRLWIGNEEATTAIEVLPWLVAAYWLLALNIVPYNILLGMGRMRFVALAAVGAGIAGVAVTPASISALGLPGAAAGRSMYALVSIVLLLPVGQYLYQERQAQRVHRPD